MDAIQAFGTGTTPSSARLTAGAVAFCKYEESLTVSSSPLIVVALLLSLVSLSPPGDSAMIASFRFFIARRSGEAGPVAWRMFSAIIDKAKNSFSMFLDGRLVADSRKGLRINKQADFPVPTWLDVTSFSGGFFTWAYLEFDGRATHRTSPAVFRAADIRLYPRALTESELQRVHLESRWPLGTEWPPQGDLMRQVL